MRYVKLAGDGLEIFEQWKQDKQEVADAQQEWLEANDYNALAILRGAVVGVVLEDEDEPAEWMKKGKLRMRGGQTYWTGDRRYNTGKDFNKTLQSLNAPDHEELFTRLGIPHIWADDAKVRHCGFCQVGDDWYVTGTPDELPELAEGCEVLKEWEFLKRKDEASDG